MFSGLLRKQTHYCFGRVQGILSKFKWFYAAAAVTFISLFKNQILLEMHLGCVDRIDVPDLRGSSYTSIVSNPIPHLFSALSFCPTYMNMTIRKLSHTLSLMPLGTDILLPRSSSMTAAGTLASALCWSTNAVSKCSAASWF